MSSGRVLMSFIFLVLVNLSAFAPGWTLKINHTCIESGNYTSNNPAYRANLDSVLKSLPTNVDSNGFYNASAGQNPDRSNAMVLCRGDIGLDVCRDCVQNAAADLLINCSYTKQAIIWFDLCTLRYSNETMFGTLATSPGVYSWNGTNATSPDQYKRDLESLLDDLQNQAASGGSLRKVAAGNTTGPDSQRIFALVQCTPDLSRVDCAQCLNETNSEIRKIFAWNKGGKSVRPSCNARYQSDSFFNEARLEELAVQSPTEQPKNSGCGIEKGKDDGNSTRTIIIVVVSIAACAMLAVFVVMLLIKKRNPKPTEQLWTTDGITTPESLQYAFSLIRDATNDFSYKNKLGQGGFGAVYQGRLPNGQEIAVKRLSTDSGQGTLEFTAEVSALARLRHRNLVRFLGFTSEGTEKLLVYEFVQNGSPDHFIFESANRSYLDWDRRFKIIRGIAKGMLYLHEGSRLRIIHRDLKAGNVLLDGEMMPKIADFGLAKSFEQDETQANTRRIVGTRGYMPPEYLLDGQFSIKSDVFSFGVLVLEIISGRRNNSLQSEENVVNLLSFAWRNWSDGTGLNIVDPFLRSSSSSTSDILRCIHIGLLCVQENAVDRPTMASVVLMLSSISMTLATPSEPAFYMRSGYDSHVSSLQENNLSKGYMPAQSEEHLSKNDVSLSDLYPR